MEAPELPTRLKIANVFLAPFGRRYVPSYLGRWSVVNDKLTRRLLFTGWRCAKRGEWEGLPDRVSELDRFAHKRGLKMP